MEPRLRRAARALVLDERDRLLLLRFDLTDQGIVLWATPGGGVEAGESVYAALARELSEEIGLDLPHDARHVWSQRAMGEHLAPGYDGVETDYFLFRTQHFTPMGTLGTADLADENITAHEWWSQEGLSTYSGHALFAPRELPRLLRELLAGPVPTSPRAIGL